MDLIQILGLITATAAAVAVVWRVRKWFVNIIDGVKCQLRSDMLHTYYKNKDEKRIRQYELENFVMSYSAYKALNGNSFIEEVHDEVTKWEIIS